ncbi:Ankyrin repeat-containing domain protein [Elaphomyces granulatus]
MTLLALPTEIIQLIGDQLDDARLNALTQAHHRMHQLLNDRLYRRDVIKPHSRSLDWATWATSTSREATARKDTVLCAIEAGRHLKQVPDSFHTALAVAASQGYADIVEALLTLDGIDPNFNPDDRDELELEPPIILAVGGGHSAIVKMLLAAVNIDPNVTDRLGATPLNSAVEDGHIAIVKMLLAAVNIDPNVSDIWGSTPLHSAACSWRNIVPFILTGKDVDPDIVSKLLLAHSDVDINFQAPDGDTALMCADDPKRCLNACDDIILDQEGIDINPRSMAASCNVLACAKLLLEREDVKWDLPDKAGRTPLFCACAGGNLPMVDLLLKKKGVNPNAGDDRGCTPLADVCGFQDKRIINCIEELVELLLSHPDTDPCAVDNDGASALDKCSGNKYLPDDTRNTILGLLQAHPRYQRTPGINEGDVVTPSFYEEDLMMIETGVWKQRIRDKVKTFAYLLMAQAVRDYLPVPSAEVGIEQVFSGGRDVLGLRRQSMSAETMQWLMLLKGANEKK